MGLARLSIIAVLSSAAFIRRALFQSGKVVILSMASILVTIFGTSQDLRADEMDSKYHGKGLIPPTVEQLQHIENHWSKVIKVRPNKIGAARIKAQMELNGLAAVEIPIAKSQNEEFMVESKGVANVEKASSVTTLPGFVDNSTLPSFPRIGDQGHLDSSVAWATTYYQASHEIGLMNGLNNKTSTNGVLSPKWTYNMINNGMDNGANFQDAYTLLSQNGAISIRKFPYDCNYLQWDLSPQDWINAISWRMSISKYIPGLGGSQTQDLTRIKGALTNGHVVTFGTYIDSWVFTRIKENPSCSNRCCGEKAVSWMNGSSGPQLVTIVGYDDQLWIDVNGNGQVDPGETGAFLVANSWGDDWGNHGFMWISYDAFLAVSAVPDGPSEGRVPAAVLTDSNVFYATAKAYNYSPSVIAQFGLSQTKRNQIKVTGGVSPTSQATPKRYFSSGAIYYQGGPYEFNGSSWCCPESGTFALDLTDLITVNSDQRYYLMINDNTAGYPTTLNSFALVDLVHKSTIKNPNLPQSVDNGKITNYIEYEFTSGPQGEIPLDAQMTSPLNDARVYGMVPVTVKTNSQAIQGMEFYVDRALIATENFPPYLIYLDTTKLSNGKHRLTAVVYDTFGQQVTTCVLVNVQN